MRLLRNNHHVLRLGNLHLSHNTIFGSHGTPTARDVATVVERSAASSTCSSGNNSSACEKPTSAGNGNLTVALAAAIPIAVSIVVLFFLHRRIRRKLLKAEDANDKHRSLDFGLDDVPMPPAHMKNRKTGQEMSYVEKPLRHGRGLSLDMATPYVLPAALHDSRESFHSMSRSLQDMDDPYRPVTFVQGDRESPRSPLRPRLDNGSIMTASSAHSNDTMNAHLLKNAARMSRSQAPPSVSDQQNNNVSAIYTNAPPRFASQPAEDLGETGTQGYQPRNHDMAVVHNDHHNTTSSDELMLNDAHRAQHYPENGPVFSNQDQGYEQFDLGFNQHSNYANEQLQPNPPSPPKHEVPTPPQHDVHLEQQSARRYSFDAPIPLSQDHEPQRLGTQPPALDRRVSVMGMRPLPPDDPTDNPEQRANRIRSFYKEYFDDSKPNPPGQYPTYNPYAYEEEYTADIYDDGAMYDPETGAFYMPQAQFTQPEGRRAMTPPPQGSSQFRPGHRHVMSTQSATRGPNGFLRPGPQAPLKKRLPPPLALATLPTPHMLANADSLAMSSIDFAPPSTFRDRQNGRTPDSPTGVSRPYSPAFAAHVPLARSFDDLAVMPSAHALSVSGTFTGLDFAPPPRFKRDDGTSSDAGSIKSNRSGISAIQREMVRNGAYRVSRLPADTVGTKMDLATSLKPTWDMRGSA